MMKLIIVIIPYIEIKGKIIDMAITIILELLTVHIIFET